MKTWFIASLVALFGSCIAAAIYLAGNRWFGAGDLYGMAIWTLPLAVLVGAVVSITTPVVRRAAGWGYLIAVLAGPTLGLVWTIGAALLLGGWIGAFSFPVPYCWMFGAILGLLVATWRTQPSSWPIAAVLGVLALAGLLQANAYARAPEPRVALYLKPGATPAEVQSVWETVIGRPSTTGTGHDLLPGISGATASSHVNGQAVLTISFRKHLSRRARDSLMAQIRRSPLVERTAEVSVNDTSGVRTSVSY